MKNVIIIASALFNLSKVKEKSEKQWDKEVHITFIGISSRHNW